MGTVTATFKNRAAAADAVDRLIADGCRTDDISVVMTDETLGREFGIEENTKAPEGAAIGGATGGALGALAAGLAATGAIAAPGVGLLAAGPLVAALSGGGAGAATGGLVGALIGAGFNEHEAKVYEDGIKDGSILLAVHTDDNDVDSDHVEEVLESCGANNIS